MSKIYGPGTKAFRASEPILLADQLVSWSRWRAGDPINRIADIVGRQRTAVRTILFGSEAQ